MPDVDMRFRWCCKQRASRRHAGQRRRGVVTRRRAFIRLGWSVELILVLMLIAVGGMATAMWLCTRAGVDAVPQAAEAASPFAIAMMAGDSAFHSGEFPRAVAEYSIAIKEDPGSAEAYYRRGSAYLKLRDLDAAKRDLDEAIQLDDNFVEAYNNRAMVALLHEDL